MATVFANLNFDNNMSTFGSQLKSALLYFCNKFIFIF